MRYHPTIVDIGIIGIIGIALVVGGNEGVTTTTSATHRRETAPDARFLDKDLHPRVIRRDEYSPLRSRARRRTNALDTLTFARTQRAETHPSAIVRTHRARCIRRKNARQVR